MSLRNDIENFSDNKLKLSSLFGYLHFKLSLIKITAVEFTWDSVASFIVSFDMSTVLINSIVIQVIKRSWKDWPKCSHAY